MENLEEKIFALMENNTLVFQTQTVADSWTLAYARKYGSVFKDRAISWDSFRDSCTEYPKGCKTADDTDRKIFLQLFSEEPVFRKLKYYADFSYPESLPAYINNMAQDLPKLCKAYEQDGQIKKDLYEKAPQELINDIKILVPNYRKFLTQNKLYEKNLYTPDFKQKSDYILVFPETFREFEVEEAVKVCKVFSPQYPQEIYKDFTVYKNSTAEIRSVLRQVREILNNKATRPTDIALTVADLKSYKAFIKTEAEARGIKCDFADSQALSQLPPGRFFVNFLKVRKENFSFDSMKELLLNPQFPLADRTDYAWMLTCAVKLKISEGLENWNTKLNRNKNNQAWPNTQEDNINNRLAFEAFERFESAVKTFESTVKSDNLRESFITLCKNLFTDEQWTSKDNDKRPQGEYAKVFGSCMDELAKLEEKAGLYGIKDTEVLLEMYPKILESVYYLENKKTLGLKVYNYPISAGLNIKHHFVLNLSDTLTRCQRDPYPFLSKEALKRREIGTEIIGNYLVQGAKLYGCTESYSGPSVMPTCFIEEGRNISGKTGTDSLDEEKQIWDENLSTIKMAEAQKQGFETMLKTGLDYSEKMQFPTVEKPMDLSISGIKDFESCPYKIFARNILKLKETKYTVAMEDAARIGDILHSTVQIALKECKKMGDLKKERLKEIFKNEVYIKYSQSNDAPPKIYLDHIYKTYDKILGKFTDCGTLHDFELVAIEDETAYSIKIKNINFKGRADLVLKDKEDRYAVIDLKKNASDYHSSKDINKTSLQLILYARLLKANPKFNKVPVYGAYYSFAEGKFREVWPETDISTVEENFEQRLTKLEDLINNNEFYPQLNAQSCKFCSFKTLCRGGYEIK